MKHLIFLLIFFPTISYAQPYLNFDKRFVQSEDRWVAFQMDKDSSYPYGFIYIDPQAGLTLNYQGNFKISPKGIFTPKKIDSVNVKVRLPANNVLVAFIPEDKFKELNLSSTPDWLKYYKTDTASVERLYKWGFMYNGWNECAKALTYLEKAQKINPNFKGLSVELAFSYNCLKQYDKSINVLEHALNIDSTDAYTNKELIYAQIKLGRLDEASERCRKALKICTDQTYNGENCYNLLHSYFEKNDRLNFNLWLAETKKWTSSSAELTRSIKIMENEISK